MIGTRMKGMPKIVWVRKDIGVAVATLNNQHWFILCFEGIHEDGSFMDHEVMARLNSRGTYTSREDAIQACHRWLGTPL